MHAKRVKALSDVMRLVWDLRDVCYVLTPCDLTILDGVWGRICNDAVLYTLVFMMKEPTAILEFVRLAATLGTSYSADELLRAALVPLTAFMNGQTVKTEHENLGGQGLWPFCKSSYRSIVG